jgi:hypothetical protein
MVLLLSTALFLIPGVRDQVSKSCPLSEFFFLLHKEKFRLKMSKLQIRGIYIRNMCPLPGGGGWSADVV